MNVKSKGDGVEMVTNQRARYSLQWHRRLFGVQTLLDTHGAAYIL